MIPQLIKKTGQAWKVKLGFAALIGGDLVRRYGSGHRGQFHLVPLGLLLGLTGLVYAWLAVRGHACGARWIWMAMSEQPLRTWGKWLFDLQACPRCGVEPAMRTGSGSRATP
ncbi:MAG: hypothetical protein QM778_29100 [Myxococcales bacterium]